ncbi:4-hydroxyphenylacetate 3-hydroxylase family protein [Saccharothrix australiensis]|uniref:4-hydroxyphenylacetate 3-monooxygenase n=1 Tax=Saccharothrix australiensis TaxID=2072 RepID=A0A495W706_9PSEU|nr:4-hydroxyphenylacetate 3-hydroxylase N-terminal domain-containing protein [Saccharothrix australiensis]RKT55588.1 4-hydroxyphenylacetate 3-monooxygenase [Saccharothrix australiensis]
MRTGAEYLAALKDARRIYLDGAPVEDVAHHPAFAPVARTIAELFDLAADPASGMTRTDPDTGGTVNRLFTTPRSREDLTAFREAATTWARHTHGWVGRSPDHVGAFVSAFAAHPEAFAGGDHDFAANVAAYRRRVAEENLYVSYAIIPPQVSRATTAHAWEGDFVQVGVVEERADGIVVRGAQMLATGGAVADEIFVSCIKPLSPEDTDFALGFAVPVAVPGLKLYCRRPYAPAATSGYDYPLTTRYDETDALLVFDDVFVPWERVFVYKDVAGLRRQFFDTGAHALGNWQAQIRFAVKLQFLAGLARKVTAVNGVDRFPGVVEKLGELASLVSLVESAVLAAEYTAEPDAQGMWRPGARALYGAMGLQAELYPRVLGILRDLVGGGVLQVPSSVADLTSDETRADIDRYVHSPGTPAEERVKLFKLAWDAIGSEFAGRHHQYELFYAGAPFVVKGYAFRNYGFDGPVAAVDGFLSAYGLAEENA